MLANHMIEDATISGKHFAYSKSEQMLYCFDGIIYREFERIDLDKFFHDFMVQYEITEEWKASRLSEVERAMRVNDKVPRVEMNDYDNRICFRNGVLDMVNLEMKPHATNDYFSRYVDVDYNPEVGAKPKVFIEVLEKIFFKASIGEPDQQTIDLIQCIGGALIFPKNKLRQLFMFLGGGSNGKSILMNVFALFFPVENITYLSLEELGTKNLERARLLKSAINFCSEEKGGNINSEEIKRIVYGEGITVRRKNKEAVEFIPNTKIVVAANNRPFFNDTSYGLERRLTIVSFDNMFLPLSKYNKVKNATEQGVFVAEDDDILMAALKKERTQILNFFLEGLKKLVDNKWEMPESLSVKKTKEEYLSSNDTVGTWLRDNFTVSHTRELSISQLLSEYREWYHDNVSTRSLNFAANTLGMRIKEIFKTKPIRRVVNGKKITFYKLEKKYEQDSDIPEGYRDGGDEEMGYGEEQGVFKV